MSGKAPAPAPRLAVEGPAAPRLPPLAHECAAAGLRMMALPPGPIELAIEQERHMINLVPVTMTNEVMRAGGTDLSGRTAERDGLCWQPAGCDMRLKTVNAEWEAVLEIDPLRLDALAHEALSGRRPTGEFVYWTPDPRAAPPARLLVEHLRCGSPEPLYAEGLAIAVVSRGLRLAAGGLAAPATRGTDARIARAMEHVEAHLGERLGLADLAAVACMSPWHFLRCFRDATGSTPAAWVRARRVALARRLLAGPMPLAEVAHATGFASQAHFTRVFRAQVGATPGAYRALVRR